MSAERLPKLAIFGLGAITVTIARALYKTKTPFRILSRNIERKMELKTNPITFQFRSEPIETFAFFDFAENIDACKETFDYIFIGSKNVDLGSSIKLVSKFLAPEGKFILIQNGFPELKLSLENEKIIGGVVGWNTQRLKNGTYFQSNIGSLILGHPNNRMPDVYLGEIFGKFIPTILTDNLTGYRWHKLGINRVINGLAASCMITLGKLMLNKIGRKVSIKILSEVKNAMLKSEIKEAVVPGSIAIKKLGDGVGSLPKWIRHLILIFLGLKYYRIKTSMVQDLEAGRMTEIDDINGTLINISKNLGLQSIMNKTVYERVKLLERKQTRADIHFLLELDKIII